MKGENHPLLEKIYDPNLDGVELLRKVVLDNQLDEKLNELLIDIDNLRRNQILHDQIKILTIKGFTTSFIFAFISLFNYCSLYALLIRKPTKNTNVLTLPQQQSLRYFDFKKRKPTFVTY